MVKLIQREGKTGVHRNGDRRAYGLGAGLGRLARPAASRQERQVFGLHAGAWKGLGRQICLACKRNANTETIWTLNALGADLERPAGPTESHFQFSTAFTAPVEIWI